MTDDMRLFRARRQPIYRRQGCTCHGDIARSESPPDGCLCVKRRL